MLQTQVASAALHLPSSIRSRNSLPTKDPPILRLPVELALIIFGHCSSGIKARLSLSHTCRHWMTITSGTGTLWTDIRIVVNYPAESRIFDNLLSLLEMQLDRAAGMPLDVIWSSNQTSAFGDRVVSLLRRKAPFSQWRTLQIRFRTVHPHDELVFRPGDAFSNLESLTIFPSLKSSIIGVLNRTTTSKLQVLDHRSTNSPFKVDISDCTDMIRRIRCLKTSYLINNFPSNITQLDTVHQTSHPFPHLLTYNIQACAFSSDYPPDLRCLETLNVGALAIVADSEVSLPSLRLLTCGTISLFEGAKISAPLLENMHIVGHRPVDALDGRPDFTGEAIKNEGFLFSPSHSLTVESVLPFDSIVKLLERSSRVERVSLGFSDEECAVQVLERIGEASSEVDSEGVPLCERLKDLRLTFSWNKCDVESWKERAGRVVKNGMGNGAMLRIYGAWKGEGTYVLLA